MRKFRAIVLTPKEPLDHEVLWYWKGKLLYWGDNTWLRFNKMESPEVEYTTSEDTSITTVKEALDKLIYVTPEVDLHLKLSGTYEVGTVIDELNFTWNYNKKLLLSQVLNGESIDITKRSYDISESIDKDTTFIIEVSDGTNTSFSTTSINFIEYIYISTSENSQKAINPTSNYDINVPDEDYLRVFIPKSLEYSKIYINGIDSTDSFNIDEEVTSMINDLGATIEGTLYISKWNSLGTLTIEFK